MSREGRALLASFRAGERPSFDRCVPALRGLFPALGELADTPQDPEWHAEGDVHVHCSMVLDALYAGLETPTVALDAVDRDVLFLGAVLHDVAKPATTTTAELRGVVRTVAPKHEERGRGMVAQGLLELGLPYRAVRDVMALVGYHQAPKLLVVKDRPDSAWRNLARKAPLHLLYALEQADMRGRVCPDLPDQLAVLDLFREQSERLGLWGRRAYDDWHAELAPSLPPDPELVDYVLGRAVTDHEAGDVAVPSEALARSYGAWSGPGAGFGQLWVLVGPSGSGKSTWAERNLPGAVWISLDALRDELTGDRSDQSANGEVRQEATRRLKQALAARRTVVWDATNLRADFRRPLVQLARAYGASTTLVVVHRTTAAIRAGNRGRAHPVDARVLADQLDRYQWPEEDEADRVLVVGEGTGELYRAGFWAPPPSAG
ncbi:MAG: AAA family ATPase [Myxococcota bacterium]